MQDVAHDYEFIVKSVCISNYAYSKYSFSVYKVEWRYIKENDGKKTYAYDGRINLDNSDANLSYYKGDKFRTSGVKSTFERNHDLGGIIYNERLYNFLKIAVSKSSAPCGILELRYQFRLIYDSVCGAYPGDALEVYLKTPDVFKTHFENMINYLLNNKLGLVGLRLKVTGFASPKFGGEDNSKSKDSITFNENLAKGRGIEGISFIKKQFNISDDSIIIPGDSRITYNDRDGNDHNRDQSVCFRLLNY